MDPMEELLSTHSELNPPHVDEFHEPPSALEFMRYVAKNTPFVVRASTTEWPAVRKWNADYLRKALKGQSVNVAVTPIGNADSPIEHKGRLIFVKPWEENQVFDAFLDYVCKQELSGDRKGEVRYAQTQNDNLRGEYEILFEDVEKEISWARLALEKEPEAINLWIGNSQSITALHRDPYENVYCQILGQKHFVLMPPLAYPCIGEQSLKPAHYVRKEDSLVIEEEDGAFVPFATWDPDKPVQTRYSHLASVARVTLNPGDQLYLPALW